MAKRGITDKLTVKWLTDEVADQILGKYQGFQLYRGNDQYKTSRHNKLIVVCFIIYCMDSLDSESIKARKPGMLC